jgi:excisionase family DNA binding protein
MNFNPRGGTNMTLKLLTVPQVAASLELSQATIRKWVLLRKITSIRVGRAVRIEEAELQRILVAGRRPAKGPAEE